jgi:penicillin-insensitive murein endopeptidase
VTTRALGVAFLCAPALAACMGTPTPLAPGVSGSVGAPHRGVQTGAVELPQEGTGFVRYRKFGTSNWGNPRLVAALEEAARTVHDEIPGGAPLVIGDLSAEYGGKIPRHQSHRTGRDVDLPWLVTTPGGAPIQNPGFVPIGADGLAALEDQGGSRTGEGYVRLDLAREWLLLKSLLGSPRIQVEWMFCSVDVEALLVDYARAKGEPYDLVLRAETVLMQPTDSLAHDDHIHMRIACTPDEAVLGCEGGGPRWEWLAPLPELPAGDEPLYEAAQEDEPLDPALTPVDGSAPDEQHAGDGRLAPQG